CHPNKANKFTQITKLHEQLQIYANLISCVDDKQRGKIECFHTLKLIFPRSGKTYPEDLWISFVEIYTNSCTCFPNFLFQTI
ncbi:MAG: hypothetical protein VX583_00030, partial [Bdellovibrionota bacterium]